MPLSISGFNLKSSFLTVASALKFLALAGVQAGRVVVSLKTCGGMKGFLSINVGLRIQLRKNRNLATVRGIHFLGRKECLLSNCITNDPVKEKYTTDTKRGKTSPSPPPPCMLSAGNTLESQARVNTYPLANEGQHVTSAKRGTHTTWAKRGKASTSAKRGKTCNQY